jgi:hypothetical protein
VGFTERRRGLSYWQVPYFDTLRAATATMSRFERLRYLTLISAGERPSLEEEDQIAKDWAQACPSLRTIILPQGRIWFTQEGEWR